MLPIAVDRSSFDDSAIRYVVVRLVLWMTSCFHIMRQIQMQAIGELFAVTHQVAPGAKSASLIAFLVHGQVTIIFAVSVCLSVCLFVQSFFSAVFDRIWIKLGHMLHVRV